MALLYAQSAHSLGLNDVCDSLRHHSTALQTIRGATPPSRNGLSHANRQRDSQMAKELFWATLDHLKTICPSFGKKNFKAIPRRFKRAIHAVDSSTIELVVNSIDWAKHRRRKAAAKLHLRLDLRTFLPKFAIFDTAADSDPKRAREVCVDLNDGEIVVFDKAYVDYLHLFDLSQRGVYWVSRSKENMSFVVVNEHKNHKKSKIVRDDEIIFDKKSSNENYPSRLRRIEAWVEVDGKPKLMTFISNNLNWAASTICDLYKSRWQIEVFFKQIKQTLQLCDFLGHNANAVGWQIWMALLLYVLMRFLAHQSKWNHSFTRLFTLIRGILWDKYCLHELLVSYGTAGGDFRFLASPDQLYLPGFG